MLACGINGEPSTMAYLRAATVHYSWAEISEKYLTREKLGVKMDYHAYSSTN